MRLLVYNLDYEVCLIKFILIGIIVSGLSGQSFIPADPFNLIKYEQENSILDDNNQSFLLRPILPGPNKTRWGLILRNEFFINDNHPNLENMGNRWLGKGGGYFTGLNISYLNKYISFSVEPYYFVNQNQHLRIKNRVSPFDEHYNIFNVLNDNRRHLERPYKIYGVRESSLFIHYNQFGIGISNANMWWGPGIHTSLTMTNNTTGFPHIMIGTLNEKRIHNIGINLRYIFSELNKVPGNPYYTALVWTARVYTKPIFSFGFSRNYLSGGLPTDRPFTMWDALKLPLEWLFIDTKIQKYPSEWEAHDRWNQTMSGFVTMEFPNSRLKLFMEIGTDDHRQNWSDLRSQPDHNSASIIGLRKYGLLNNRYILSGFEYANIKRSYTHKFRGGGHWWWTSYYDYSTYDGRRWASHSGSDSDDFYLFFGYNDSKWTFIPGFNYERHGIISGNPPEIKIEFRLDIRFIYNDYLINLYYERELIDNSEFVPNRELKSNVLWFGIEKDLSALIYGFSK